MPVCLCVCVVCLSVCPGNNPLGAISSSHHIIYQCSAVTQTTSLTLTPPCIHRELDIDIHIDAVTQTSLTTVGIRDPLLLVMTTTTTPSFLTLLGDDLQILFFSLWLDVRSLSTLDVAVSCHRLRPCWMALLKRLRSPAVDGWGHGISSLMWLSKRGIRVSRVQMKMDTSRVRVCDILMVDTSDLVTLGLRDCYNTTDQCVVDIINRCPKLMSIDLGGCRLVTDAGVSALGAGCGQLQSIDLSCCEKVTDAGISALSAGCGQLQRIDLAGCHKVTDAGVSALGHIDIRR